MRIGMCNYVDANGNRCMSEGVVKVALRKRGNRNACFCALHADTHQQESYYAENSIEKGCQNYKNGITCSMELETHGRTRTGHNGSNIKGKMELVSAGFIPTSDSTVAVEYKSPIWHGLKAPSHVCNTIQHLLDDHDIKIDESCGTHFHVGIKGEYGINADTMGYIRRFAHSLFVPLSDAMLAHPEETCVLFGRGFGDSHWAQPISHTSNEMNHTNFINLEHNPTIEYRLCKFQDAKQYQKLMKMCVEFTKIISNTFIKHFNDDEAKRRGYFRKVHSTEEIPMGLYDEDAITWRKIIAKDAADKLVKVYLKNIEQ